MSSNLCIEHTFILRTISKAPTTLRYVLWIYFVEEKQKVKAGDEPGMLGVLRTKLLKFLRESQHYVAAEHISSFPQDGTYVSHI